MIPDALCIIAGKGAYPRLLAESAREQGVRRIVAIAFRRETDPRIENVTDEVTWIHLGQLKALLDAMQAFAIAHAVMAGQITPTHLFTVRMDKALLSLLKQLPARNADTIFSAVSNEIRKIGTELMPAHCFMEKHMPHQAGVLTLRHPDEREQADFELGYKVAQATSGLEIGQTVLIKEGTVLAVEAFEGTDAAIRRAGKLGGSGAVLVKLAKQGHDMRFDIPVIGQRTVKSIKKAGVSAVLVESGRVILLERETILQQLNQLNVTLVVKEPDHE